MPRSCVGPLCGTERIFGIGRRVGNLPTLPVSTRRNDGRAAPDRGWALRRPRSAVYGNSSAERLRG